MSDFVRMWCDLAPIGRSAASGGYHRQPFTAADIEMRAWFAEECRRRDLVMERDPFGNLAAWWDPHVEPASSPADPDSLLYEKHPFRAPGGASRIEVTGVLTGSHLDSVPDGGAYDGPLGVVSALAAIDLLRERGVTPARPIGVAVFAEEEGSRFGLACLGSRLATGALSWERAAALRDGTGVTLPEAMTAAGIESPGTVQDPAHEAAPDRSAYRNGALLENVGCFVELHVEQGRCLVNRRQPVGAASGIWPHGRYRFEFEGQANHAGTTRMEDRRDPMLSFSMTALAANKHARIQGQRATFGRVEVTPNGTNAVPSRVTAWLDARCSSDDALEELVGSIGRRAAERAELDGTTVTVVLESVTAAVHFDDDLTGRIITDHPGGDWPVLATQAGHDAGILASAGIPTAMLFVRNPTGVSHSPAEHAEVADCVAGVEALAETLTRLAT